MRLFSSTFRLQGKQDILKLKILLIMTNLFLFSSNIKSYDTPSLNRNVLN